MVPKRCRLILFYGHPPQTILYSLGSFFEKCMWSTKYESITNMSLHHHCRSQSVIGVVHREIHTEYADDDLCEVFVTLRHILNRPKRPIFRNSTAFTGSEARRLRQKTEYARIWGPEAQANFGTVDQSRTGSFLPAGRMVRPYLGSVDKESNALQM